MIVLGIESTCDETAAALVEDGRHLLSNVISTSVKEQALYGGVVPEIASRRHCEFISATVKKALLDAGKTMDDVDAVAVTFAPGLIGAVLVGVNFAKGLAYSANKPLVPVHHLRGHIAALYLTHPELKPPFLCLVASGGHSHIVEVQDYTHYHILGHTVDDAAGEAFDKVARTLGLPRMLLLGLQHLFAMFGATVLVPILVQSYGLPLSIQTTLLFAGLGTLLFHVCTKLKVPAFLGSSFAFLGGFEAVSKLDVGKFSAMSGEEKLPYALGGIVIAGGLYLVLALLFKLVGAKKVMRFFPPIVTGPIIILIGLNLSGTAISNASTCWWLALVAIAIIIVANIWGKGMVKIIPILLGVVGSYLVALIATACGAHLPDANGVMQPLVSFASVKTADFVGLQQFVIAKFDLTSILVMAPIAIAAMMEHIGDISAISSTTGKNFIADPGLHRTLLGDGLATAVAGMFGGPANTTYGENTGVLALSKVYDPRVIRLAALYAIILSFSPKFDALVNSIPTAIVGGVSFVLYGMISAVGVRNVVENKVDLTKSRNLIIAAVIFVSGLGFSSTGGITFTVGSADITLTGLAIAALAGVILNAILPGNDYEFGTDPQGDKSADLGSY